MSLADAGLIVSFGPVATQLQVRPWNTFGRPTVGTADGGHAEGEPVVVPDDSPWQDRTCVGRR